MKTNTTVALVLLIASLSTYAYKKDSYVNDTDYKDNRPGPVSTASKPDGGGMGRIVEDRTNATTIDKENRESRKPSDINGPEQVNTVINGTDYTDYTEEPGDALGTVASPVYHLFTGSTE